MPDSNPKHTLKSLNKIFKKMGNPNIFLMGGVSIPIQTGKNFYRKNEDIDIMCSEEKLPQLILELTKLGYVVEDKRGVQTGNRIDLSGKFIAEDHNLNADSENKKLLGIGIFTYSVKGQEVTTFSYVFDEKESKTICIQKTMPKELFDLMYEDKKVKYKGMELKTQSKEYTYLNKSNGTRPKDKEDCIVIKESLDASSKEKISRIKILQTKIRKAKIFYEKDGTIVNKVEFQTLEEKVYVLLDNYLQSCGGNIENAIKEATKSKEYLKLKEEGIPVDKLLNDWSKNSIKAKVNSEIDKKGHKEVKEVKKEEKREKREKREEYNIE